MADWLIENENALLVVGAILLAAELLPSTTLVDAATMLELGNRLCVEDGAVPWVLEPGD